MLSIHSTNQYPDLVTQGYEYMTLGGIGYANGSTCTPPSSCNITRNATGYLQVNIDLSADLIADAIPH